MSRLLTYVVLLSSLVASTTLGQESVNLPQTPNMIGFSVNNALWSNNLGPVANIEVSMRPFRAIKFEVGYFFHPTYSIITFNSLPENIEPRLDQFSGIVFLTEYKRYNKNSYKGNFAKNYFSAYYQYKYLSAKGIAVSVNQLSNIESAQATVYRSLPTIQSELINEIGVKYGSLYKLAEIKSRPLLLETYFGVGYQFVVQNFVAEDYDPDHRIYFKKLKNGTLIGRQGDEASRNRYFVPVLRFGVNLNLAFPKT